MGEGILLAVHGGAGTLSPETMNVRLEQSLHAGLRAALLAGSRVLRAGGPALDAVTAAVVVLEDDAQFNAGHGAVFNADGGQEMDAAIMDGRSGQAGAVASICGPRNPVMAARAVMERSPHVMLSGPLALPFLRHCDVRFEDAEYFQTERRWRALQVKLDRRNSGSLAPLEDADRHGTVGAVARDATGGLAAATSSGGITGKQPGRVGDSPVIGAGTWASESCAVSATGDGESFIRLGAAHEVEARLRLGGQDVAAAGEHVVQEVGRRGGSGGLIAIDADGKLAMPFNTRGMYRGWITADGIIHTAIHRDPPRVFYLH